MAPKRLESDTDTTTRPRPPKRARTAQGGGPEEPVSSGASVLSQLWGRTLSKLEKLRDELAACYSEISDSPKHKLDDSRWHTLLYEVDEIFNGERCGAWSSIGTLPRSSCGEGSEPLDVADVWYMSMEELEGFCNAANPRPLDKPIVVPGQMSEKKGLRNSRLWLEKLHDRHANSSIDTQNYAGKPTSTGTKRIPTTKLHQGIETALGQQDRAITNKRLPLNGLNLRDILDEPIPEVLKLRRFGLLSSLLARGESGGILDMPAYADSSAGKHRLRKPQDDVTNCRTFNLFAQRGSWSGPHTDVLGGTWVHNLGGYKAWY
ncbi:hypothetical protein LTS18_005037 [Coniosporium uncinatum]|uniref:Uncharacterized protein n=1 Tax=Coniosporium uncinatum TaxID=93489 RepID=A0ACC3DRM8_9PEZI|nr:hypothetical protein LTS18_005037 [Coniosporium uncinatum]